MLECGVRIPALMSWVSGFMSGVQTLLLLVLSQVWVCCLEFARPRALLSMCVLWCCMQFVFLSAACFHVDMLSCVNTWLISFLISCVFVSCFEHGWWFVCWPCAYVFVLCEHMVFVLVFCVPCAFMSIVLTPPILLTDYWLIFPTCLSSLPSSFAPFIIFLCLHSCASSSSFHHWC